MVVRSVLPVVDAHSLVALVGPYVDEPAPHKPPEDSEARGPAYEPLRVVPRAPVFIGDYLVFGYFGGHRWNSDISCLVHDGFSRFLRNVRAF